MTIGAQHHLCSASFTTTGLRHDRVQRVKKPTTVVMPARKLAGQVARQWQSYHQCVPTMARSTPHLTVQHAPQQSRDLSSKGVSAAEGRQMLVDSIPLESFKMTGVSFESRQDLVSRLQPGNTAVMFS